MIFSLYWSILQIRGSNRHILFKIFSNRDNTEVRYTSNLSIANIFSKVLYKCMVHGIYPESHNQKHLLFVATFTLWGSNENTCYGSIKSHEEIIFFDFALLWKYLTWYFYVSYLKCEYITMQIIKWFQIDSTLRLNG